MTRFLEEVIRRRLREYYNEVCEIMDDLDEELIDMGDSEERLIELDAKYAKIIVKELA